MAKKKLLGFIDNRPAVWLHYIVLLLALLITLYLLNVWMPRFIFRNLWQIIKVSGVLFIVLVLVDNLLHKIFKV